MARPVPVSISPQKSALMARVRQKRTKPEQIVADVLRKLGVRYRRNVRKLPGSPDFSNVSKGWAINVHGCFWHNHSCKRGTLPKHNADFWIPKLEANRARDAKVELNLRALGLKVLTVWECDLRDRVELEANVSAFLSALDGTDDNS